MNSIQAIQNAFNEFLIKQFNLTPDNLASCVTELNVDEKKQQFGDLTSNAAMMLAKVCGQAPRELAQIMQQNFSHPLVHKIDIAGPGFINIYLTEHALQQLARELFEQGEHFFSLAIEQPRYNYNVEYISANPTGPLHIGHGRGGIIGDVLGNVLRFLGHKVTKEFYVNDAGAQMSKLGNSLKIRIQQELGQTVELPEDAYQGDYLIELAKACIAQHGSDVLNNDDAFFIAYAQDHMLAQQKQTLADYGITFDIWFSEKTLHQSGAIEHALEDLHKKNQTYKKDDALWFKSMQYGDDKDRVLRKADGTLTYVAADIAYMQDKVNRGANHMIMVLGQDHHSYVTRLNGLRQALGLSHIPLDVILYQLVSIKEGGQQLRMSKRAGRMVTLREIIDLVGTDVARFFYLNRKADAHLDFDLDLALTKTDENPVYYIQYAYVRTASILAKAQEHKDLAFVSVDDTHNLGIDEKFLLKKMASLKTLLAQIGTNFQTHLLTYYVLELANAFHSYYAKHRVIDMEQIPQSRARLLLIALINKNIGTVLQLLGITQPEKM